MRICLMPLMVIVLVQIIIVNGLIPKYESVFAFTSESAGNIFGGQVSAEGRVL